MDKENIVDLQSRRRPKHGPRAYFHIDTKDGPQLIGLSPFDWLHTTETESGADFLRRVFLAGKISVGGFWFNAGDLADTEDSQIMALAAAIQQALGRRNEGNCNGD